EWGAGEADEIEGGVGLRAWLSPRRPAAVIGRKRHVLDQRELAKGAGNLKCPPDASPADCVRGKAGDFVSLKTDRSGGRAQGASNQGEGRAFARAIRADPPENLPLPHFQGDLVYRQESSQAFAERFDGEHQARAA